MHAAVYQFPCFNLVPRALFPGLTSKARKKHPGDKVALVSHSSKKVRCVSFRQSLLLKNDVPNDLLSLVEEVIFGLLILRAF